MRLSKTQEKAEKRIREERIKYDDALKDLDAEFRFRREVLKNPLKEAVNAAREEALPARRIHLAAGYQHPSGLNNFLNSYTGSAIQHATVIPETTITEQKQTAGNEKVTVRLNDWLDDPGEWYVTDTFGNQFELTTGFGANNWYSIGLEKFKEQHTDWKELQAAITEHFEGKVIWNER